MSSFDNIRSTTELQSSNILFTTGATIRINAPADHVFNTITSFSQYAEWNTDTPQMDLEGPAPLHKGSIVKMKTVMADQNRSYDIPISIQRLEAPDETGVYILAWRGNMLPTWFAISERVQEIHPIDGDPHVCEIVNYESMAGWGAYLFKYVMGIPDQMKKFNTKYLQDLKTRAESTFQ